MQFGRKMGESKTLTLPLWLQLSLNPKILSKSLLSPGAVVMAATSEEAAAFGVVVEVKDEEIKIIVIRIMVKVIVKIIKIKVNLKVKEVIKKVQEPLQTFRIMPAPVTGRKAGMRLTVVIL